MKKNIFFIFIILFFFTSSNAIAKNCFREDFVNFVSDAVGCIAINIHKEQQFNKNRDNKKKLVIFIHGDQLEKKVYYFDQFASKFTTTNSLVISITRPGWINKHNNKSDGKKNTNYGDNYIPKDDVDPIYRTIKKLKKKYKIDQTLIIGHSGGAAVTGILIGRFPKLIHEAVLISCPCIVPPWRKNFFDRLEEKTNKKLCMPKFKSHSPHEYIKKINPNLKIHIFVGTRDKNTLPIYSINYNNLLKKNFKKSQLFFIKGDHTSILTNKNLVKELKKIING